MSEEQQAVTLALTASEPVLVPSGVFLVERRLAIPGEVRVRPGERVEPATVVAVASSAAGRPITLYPARELGVAPGSVRRYLTKPVGSSFEAGEAVARARRGLRTVSVTAPVPGTLGEVDEAAGTLTFVPEGSAVELLAAVAGEVASVDDHGATIRTGGARVRGLLAAGDDAFGRLVVAVDRPDRELTPDAVTEALRGGVVVGGMTLGASAIRRLAEVGARAVVVGSVAEAELRRAAAGAETPAAAFWGGLGEVALDGEKFPLTVLVTEGFGRRPMARPLFEYLLGQEGRTASVVVAGAAAAGDPWPALYLSSATLPEDDAIIRAEPADGVVARLVDPAHLGTVVVCRSGVLTDYRRDGLPRPVVEVELASGARRLVPLANLEILAARG